MAEKLYENDPVPEDLPMFALRTTAEAEKAVESGRTLFLVLPRSVYEPRIEKYKFIKPGSIGTWSTFDEPLCVPFGNGNGFVFDNYWFAYAHILRPDKCR
jgi:hypothetical protein